MIPEDDNSLTAIDAISTETELSNSWPLVEGVINGQLDTARMDCLLRLIERFGDDDGDGLFQKIVEALEASNGYELRLVESLRRTPSWFGALMVKRLIKRGVASVGDVDLLELLRKAAKNEAGLELAREAVGDILEELEEAANNYHVRIEEVDKHTIPQLLKRFGSWLEKQEHGSLGFLNGLVTEPIDYFDDTAANEELRERGFTFLTLPDGELLALMESETSGNPPAVVQLGHGGISLVARSLEEFLIQWSKGDTGVIDLDEEREDTIPARKRFRAWLTRNKVKA